MRITRHTALRALVLLICGAFINLGVAWACVSFGPTIQEPDCDPKTRTSWPAWAPPEWPSWLDIVGGRHHAVGNLFEVRRIGASAMTQDAGPIEDLEEWLRKASSNSPSPFEISAVRLEAGLPWHSFEAEYGTSNKRHVAPNLFRGGISNPCPQSLGRLPLAPLWPGFVLNTLLYAAAIGLVAVSLRGLRRHSRTRRGLCPRCAYDLRGLASHACPECGHRRSGATTLPA